MGFNADLDILVRLRRNIRQNRIPQTNKQILGDFHTPNTPLNLFNRARFKQTNLSRLDYILHLSVYS